MLAIATPSIAQQRIVLVVFMGIIGALGWWQSGGGGADYPVQRFSPSPVPAVLRELDFKSAEAGWSGLKLDSQGHVQIDALTETALIDALGLMDGHASDLPMTRMAFLLEKQFGATASQQIIELLPQLKSYKEAEQLWWAKNASKDPPPHAELFRLQDELLGETLAKQMFSEQRRLANMMLASYQIRNDASRTQTEKDQALEDLQKTMQKEWASIE